MGIGGILTEKNIKRAHSYGCDEVKKTLENLFPSLELGVKPEFYSLDELTIRLEENSYGQFIRIDTPEDYLTSAACCKDGGSYIWVPFLKSEGMCLSRETKVAPNFRILRD